MTEHFDAVVVGSGFGGSVSAYRFAEAGKRVCLLERGKAYPPGSFPRIPREMARNVWDPSAGLHGMFDVWTFKGIEALVSSALGGGSIIYANVLIRKDAEWFVEPDGRPWAVTRAELDPHYANVTRILAPQTYPLDVEPYSRTPKTRALQRAAEGLGLDWALPDLAVTFANPGEQPEPGQPIEGEDNLHHRRRYTCRLCGECDIGCNFGSKNTLDFNYLTLFERHGGEIRTRSEVRRFAPRAEGGFTIEYVVHEPESEGRKTDTSALPLRTVTADRVVLAAGSLGSTFLLLKSLPDLGQALGSHWCGNGDLLGFLTRSPIPLDPELGPAITSRIRYEGDAGRGFYIEDGGYPGFLSWMLETAQVSGNASRAVRFLSRLIRNRLTASPVSNVSAELARLLGGGKTSSGTLPILGMGRDVPDGNLSLRDGYLQCDWTIKTSRRYYASVKSAMQELAGALDARFESQPLWYFRRVVTVHPVGGCPLGSSPDEGVVDPCGQVFGVPGLSVADGSVLPGPVGPNPSLTIAALADRFADWTIENWRVRA